MGNRAFVTNKNMETSTVVDDAEQTAKVKPEPYRYVLTDDGEKVYEGSRYLVIRQ